MRGYLAIPIVSNDFLYEGGQEDFQVMVASNSLSNIRANGNTLQIQVTIRDRESVPFIQLSEDLAPGERLDEGDGSIPIVYGMKCFFDGNTSRDRSCRSSAVSSFSWYTEDGTASGSEGDYVPITGQSFTVPKQTGGGPLAAITINDDEVPEGNPDNVYKYEDFYVKLDGSSFIGLDSDQSVRGGSQVIIYDDDIAIDIHIGEETVNEGQDAIIIYTLNQASPKDIRFTWSTSDGTAIAGNDYTPRSNQTVTILSGDTSGQLRVPIINDNLSTGYEGDESFVVAIAESSLPVNVIVVDSDLEATVTILANDPDEVKQFIQRDAGATVPVDILWVIDASGSAESVRDNISDNLSQFIAEFAADNDQDLDFNMAVLPTASSQDIVDSSFPLNLANLESDQQAFIDEFESKMTEINENAGFSRERPFKNSEKFLIDNSSWIREEAYLAIIYVVDEDDDSYTLPGNYAPWHSSPWRSSSSSYSFEDTYNSIDY